MNRKYGEKKGRGQSRRLRSGAEATSGGQSVTWREDQWDQAVWQKTGLASGLGGVRLQRTSQQLFQERYQGKQRRCGSRMWTTLGGRENSRRREGKSRRACDNGEKKE